MRLKLFEFIDEIINDYQDNLECYEQANLSLINFFTKNFQDKNESVTSVFSRIKSLDSTREKLIRNKFYLKYDTVSEAIDNLVDLVGVTVECRFIKDEQMVYNMIINCFRQYDENFYRCDLNPNIFLNLRMAQPQLQRNGFPIYRIDGYILQNDKKINFELQIKAMVHSFWSNIEHQVVYKNTKLVIFNSLISNMLSSIRDNLDVVDNQLEIIYNQIISKDSNLKEIGMTPETFKLMVATSINEFVSNGMLESVGVVTNFKQCSSILSQYIYINEFLNADNPAIKMVDYFEHLNLLKINKIDYTTEITLEKFEHDDIFCKLIGDYWISVINIDYDWHVFFLILFSLQPGMAVNDFSRFIETIKMLIMPNSWFETTFKKLDEQDRIKIKDLLGKNIAECMIEEGTLSIIHESTLFGISNVLKELVETLEERFTTFKQLEEKESTIKAYLNRHIKPLF